MAKEKSGRVTDQQFQKILFQELNSGSEAAHKKTTFWRLLKTDFKIDKSRAFRLHDQFYHGWSSLQQRTIEKTMIKKMAEETVDVIQTKSGKIEFYIAEVRKIESQLRGNEPFTFLVNTKIHESHNEKGVFQVPIQIQDQMRETIHAFLVETSKLSGEYVTKVAETDTEGNNIQKLDIESIPTPVLLELAKHIIPNFQ